jgi:predicted dehydrogenase
LAAEAGGGDFTSVLLEFEGGRSVQVNRVRQRRGARSVCLQVTAERGPASLRLPGRVAWTDRRGRHVQLLRQQPVGQVLLERFYQAVREAQPMQPTLADAQRALGWLRAAARSRDEGGRVVLQKGAG